MSFRHVEILLVEDSAEDAEMTLRTLKRRGLANRLVWVKDGVEAMDFLLSRGAWIDRPEGFPRLVLLDLKMPRMDGLQVLQQMKQDPRTQSIPVVMMTSSGQESDLMSSYELGVNSFVVKPVDFDSFAETVARVGMYWMITNQGVE